MVSFVEISRRDPDLGTVRPQEPLDALSPVLGVAAPGKVQSKTCAIGTRRTLPPSLIRGFSNPRRAVLSRKLPGPEPISVGLPASKREPPTEFGKVLRSQGFAGIPDAWRYRSHGRRACRPARRDAPSAAPGYSRAARSWRPRRRRG